MKLVVPKEIVAGERRVAVVPESVKKLTKAGVQVFVQEDAGLAAGVRDVDYADAGAEIIPDAKDLYARGELILKVEPPTQNEAVGAHEVELMPPGAILVATLQSLRNLDTVRRLTARKVTAFSMNMIPRTTRAQTMDVLSSQATAAGYKAVLLGAAASGKFFPMLTTAAGTIRPARVFVIGAGVAGLQAIATARRLGAVVEAFDVRRAVKEQVQSLGATFVEIDIDEDAETAGGYAKEVSAEYLAKEEKLLHERCRASDVVITTAQVFGKSAPRLISEDMVRHMSPGSVIVDLAAEGGGNCALTEPGKTVGKHGVTIIGELNLPATMPIHASQMYSRNVTAFLLEFFKDGKFNLRLEDDIIKAALITHEGQVVNEMVRKALSAG
ncbi:MAG TPA: Re/Si-specific NAD(P)(+) transhydrogenase subunit alpha [Phycisphaerae bacterium]|nr:Re/Si-specific NAD(P)(+) transhydrogenase subunit alpha [Phycisphaerae bacterium]HNU44065.1 Re/Si-specific NAD(P)(+) transhydrogenase subunit alpha [Phycisphaerae bacterium]